MSAPQNHPDEPDTKQPKPPADPTAEDTKMDGQPGGYTFKIVPVDPKNDFDFEDVADK